MATIHVGTSQVLCESSAGILQVTLSRPQAGNALSLPMLEGLAGALEFADTTPSVRTVILTGAGNAFCSGGDIELMARGESIFGNIDDVAGRTATQRDLQRRTVVRLHELTKPTIAVVRGPAVGAGLALALACDLRYADTTAVLMSGFGRVGLAGDFGCSWLLHHLVNAAKAKELLLRSPPVDSGEARHIGLVNAVFEPGELDSEVGRAARAIARVPTRAVEVMLATSRAAPNSPLSQAADDDAESHVRLTLTPEHREAVQRLLASMKNG